MLNTLKNELNFFKKLMSPQRFKDIDDNGESIKKLVFETTLIKNKIEQFPNKNDLDEV